MRRIQKIKSDLSPAIKGDWKTEKFSVSVKEASWYNVRARISQNGLYADRMMKPGNYTRLCNGSFPVMSDTPSEINDFYHIVKNMSGHILVSGLGLGLVVQFLLSIKDVKSITVLEVSPEVLILVKDHIESLSGKKDLAIIESDAFLWDPKARLAQLGVETFDYAWHDIWDTICFENIKEMGRLKRRYKKYVVHQFCWCERECRRG